jgi:hypothetical protein
VEEPASQRDNPQVPQRDAAFASEFPVWLLLEMKLEMAQA